MTDAISESTCDVLGIGENSVDDVYRLPGYPRAGGTAKVEILRHDRRAGGQVATTLCACARLGLSARYLGTFGNDDNGAFLREELERRGIDLRHALVRPAPNRHAVILIDDASGERVVLWRRDAALALGPQDVRPEIIARARLLHVDGVDEDAAVRAAHAARDLGVPVTSDIDRVTARTRDLVAAASIPIFAEGVAEALTGEPDAESALRAIRRGHQGLLCITLGAQGAMLLNGNTLHRVPGHHVRVVDTTGAGDVFRGAFIYALVRGDAPADALKLANAAAALSCTREGAIASVPSLEEVEALARSPKPGARSPEPN